MVHHCVSVQSGVPVAAKFVSRSLVGPDAVMREVNVVHNLRHAAVVRPSSFYETDAAYVIVMPL